MILLFWSAKKSKQSHHLIIGCYLSLHNLFVHYSFIYHLVAYLSSKLWLQLIVIIYAIFLFNADQYPCNSKLDSSKSLVTWLTYLSLQFIIYAWPLNPLYMCMKNVIIGFPILLSSLPFYLSAYSAFIFLGI